MKTWWTWPERSRQHEKNRTECEGMRVGHLFNFEAAHRLTKVPEGHKCRRLHGHSYHGRIIVESATVDARGFVMDYEEIRAILDPLIGSLDHRNLNDVFGTDFETTCENLCGTLAQNVSKMLPDGVSLVSLRIWETPHAFAEWTRD